MELKFNASRSLTPVLEYKIADGFTRFVKQSTQAVEILRNAIVDYKTPAVQERMMDDLEDVLSSETEFLTEYNQTSVYFADSVAHRVSRALYMYNECRNRIMNRVRIGSVIPAAEVADCILIMQFAISEVVGAILVTLGAFDNLAEIEEAERSNTLLVSQGLQAYIQDCDMTPSEFCKLFEEVLRKFGATLPVRLVNPDLWDMYVEKVESFPEYGVQMREFDDDMLILDCQAVINGQVDVNEDLIDMLSVRARKISEGKDIRQTNPHQFQTMIEMTSEDCADLFLRYEPVLTNEIVHNVITGKVKIDKKFMKGLESRLNKSESTEFFS